MTARKTKPVEPVEQHEPEQVESVASKYQDPIYRIWDKEGKPFDCIHAIDVRELIESGEYFAEKP